MRPPPNLKDITTKAVYFDCAYLEMDGEMWWKVWVNLLPDVWGCSRRSKEDAAALCMENYAKYIRKAKNKGSEEKFLEDADLTTVHRSRLGEPF